MFPAIGTIESYKALPLGERLLYEQFTLAKLKEAAQAPAIKINTRKGG